MPQNKSNLLTLTSMNIYKIIFSTVTIPAISLSISVHIQAQENTKELLVFSNIYSAISPNSANSAPFLQGLPNDFFYQLSQNMEMNNVVINYFSAIADINNISDMDNFYAAHIHDETGASLRLAFNSNTQAMNINFGDTVIQIEPNSAYIALRDFNTLFTTYDFGGEIQLNGDSLDIYFAYSALFPLITSHGLDYVITGENLSIENIGVNIHGWNSIIGTPDDDTFLVQEAPSTGLFSIDGGGGEDIILFEEMSDIDNNEPAENDSNTVIVGTPLSNNIINGSVTLDTGVIHINDGDLTFTEGNLSLNDNSSEGSVEITPENDGVTVVDGDSVSINFPTETTAEEIPIGTETEIIIVDSSELEFTANEPESDVLEEDDNTGGGSFSYLTLFCLAIFGFLQKQRNNKIEKK